MIVVDGKSIVNITATPNTNPVVIIATPNFNLVKAIGEQGPPGVTQDLSGYSLVTHNHTGTYEPLKGSDDNFVTDLEKVKLTNLSGVNTGDQDLSGYELLSNKQTDLTASSTKYPTVNAVISGLATKQAAGTYSTDIHLNITALDDVSGVNTGDQDLSGYSLTTHNHTGTYEPLKGTDDNFVTDLEKVKLANLSGVNTGDQDLSGLVIIAGDIGGIPTDPNILQVHKYSKTFTYNLNGQLTGLSDANGTKTFTYTDGALTGITGTGIYQSGTLSYTDGILTATTFTG